MLVHLLNKEMTLGLFPAQQNKTNPYKTGQPNKSPNGKNGMMVLLPER